VSAPTVHLTSASLLDPRASSTALAAMAKVPDWLQRYTVGRPAWSYAVGSIARLLWPALGEKRRTGRADGPAAVAYFAALDVRWEWCVSLGRFAPGVWTFRGHDGGGETLVPDGAVLVCTCAAGSGCHLERLAPHLERSGWIVTVYGQPPPPNRTESHPTPFPGVPDVRR
jgi:hypothetical protein